MKLARAAAGAAYDPVPFDLFLPQSPLQEALQLGVGRSQALRQYPGVGHHGHEIGVAVPAGDNMSVSVVSDACPC
jgi:hypothetical protein